MKTRHDWSRADALSDDEIKLRRRRLPIPPEPLTPERLARMRRTPQARTIRRALGLSQEEFAARFRIPLGTLPLGAGPQRPGRGGARLSDRDRAQSR